MHTVLPESGAGRPDYQGRPLPDLKRLAFRVPAIAMGPFAPRKIEKAGLYEHCSILKMIDEAPVASGGLRQAGGIDH
jgi:hypothetical protein